MANPIDKSNELLDIETSLKPQLFSNGILFSAIEIWLLLKTCLDCELE